MIRPTKALMGVKGTGLGKAQLKRLGQMWTLASRHPGYFDQFFVYTLDTHDIHTPIKAWCWQLPYLDHLTTLWLTYRRLAILKARQMRLTWHFVKLALWDGIFHEGRLIMLQSKREEDAIGDENAGDGLLGRAKFILNKMPFRKLLIPDYEPMGNRIRFTKRRSTLWAIPQGASIIRQRTAWGILSDEAAFQPEFGDAYTAMRPTVRAAPGVPLPEQPWVVALTTADLSDGGAFRALHEDTLAEMG